MLTIYSASAGSGKTYQLTQEYILQLFHLYKEEKMPHRRILAVTFTNKATDEMKQRILEELFLLSDEKKSAYIDVLQKETQLSNTQIVDRARMILINLLFDYASFSISTIDKFFLQIVRTFGRELGLAGNQNVFLDTEDILQQAVDNFFLQLTKENKSSMEWLRQFMEEKLQEQRSWKVNNEIAELGKELFKENYQTLAEEVYEKLHDKKMLQSYKKELTAIKKKFENRVENSVNDFQNYLREIGITEDVFKRKNLFNKLESLKSGKYELTATFRAYAQTPEDCYTQTAKAEVVMTISNNYPTIQQHLQTIINLIDNEIIEYNTANVVLKNIYTLGLLSDLAEEIRNITDEQNLMLLSNVNALLHTIIDDNETPFIYERTGLKTHHFMIDEFQDTSVLQWKNFKPLIENSIAENKFNLLVGDVKQSIYRWRNSDWKLMQEQVEKEIRPDSLRRETLVSNWRSDKNIVEFNNQFFEKNAQFLSDFLTEKLNESVADKESSLFELPKKITVAYQDVSQKVTSKEQGHLHFEFVDNSEKIWKENALERIPSIVESLSARGYSGSDIAFLVRTKGDASKLTDFMLNYKNSEKANPDINYELVGSEGLLLTSSATVRFVIDLLKLCLNPTDDICRANMIIEYLKAKGRLSETDIIDFEVQKEKPKERQQREATSLLFTKEENEAILQIRHLPIYEAIENIIHSFKLTEWYNELVFLNALQDEVFRYATNRTGDLYSFLKWWDKNSSKKYIQLPEDQEAMKVMTIHKSKGLDFKVVIMPFLEWEFEETRNRSLLWLNINQEPFNQLNVLPVYYSSLLKDTFFQESYFEEKMYQYVDNLNLMYVAFTRARNEFIGLMPKSKEIEKIKFEKSIKISELMLHYLTQNYDEKHWISEDILHIGEPTRFLSQSKEKENTLSGKIADYPITKMGNRVSIKHIYSKAWFENKPLEESRVSLGILMHEILCDTQSKEQQQQLIRQMVRKGRIREHEKELVEKELKNFWEHKQVNEWFDNDVKALNEVDILLPNGSNYRPDKVVLKGRKAIVIDYKFGEKESNRHQKQVQNYMQIIQGMNYQVEGFLYYVGLDKIVEVMSL